MNEKLKNYKTEEKGKKYLKQTVKLMQQLSLYTYTKSYVKLREQDLVYNMGKWAAWSKDNGF